MTESAASASGAEPDLRRAEKLVMEMLPIRGPSGSEGAIADFVCGELRSAGLSSSDIQRDSVPRRSRLGGETGNLIVRMPGSRRGPRRLLSAHLDTVALCVGCRPVRRGREVRPAGSDTGLGADNRAGCAVILTAALEILRQNLPHPPLTFCWFVQEEVGTLGARLVNRSLLGKPRLGFNWDGGSPVKLTIGATGGYRMDIDIRGIASHAGGAPEQGVSAVAIASLAIADLHERGWHGDIHQDGCHGTSNVGVIRGGDATNVVTDHVTIKAEARSHDPEFRQRIVREIEAAFQRAAQRVTNAAGHHGKVNVDGRLDYESFRLDDDQSCIRVAESVIRSLGLKPQRAVANGGLDANWLVRYGIPTVSLGCGQKNQHTVDEALDLDGFQQACSIGLALATGLGEERVS